MEYVLFSAVGSHDPFSQDGNDGALLHIIRHYIPLKVYLFFTSDMINKKEDCIEAITALNPKINTSVIETDITNAADFDVYSDKFNTIINRIREENSNAEILLNITSGTGQMSIALCAEVFSNNISLTPVQVDNPKFNKGANRCNIPGLLGLRKNVLKRQIKDMLTKWDYTGAYYLLKSSNVVFSEKLEHILHHAYLRSVENKAAEVIAKDKLKEIYIKLYPIADKKIKKVLNFYQILMLKKDRDEMTDFLLRAYTFAEFLIIEDINLKTMANRKHETSQEWIWDMKKAEENHPGMISEFEKKNIDFKRGLNSFAFKHIANYLKKNEYDIIFQTNLFRNSAVHDIAPITEDMLIKKYNITSIDILYSVKSCIQRIYEPADECFEIFKYINTQIIQELK